MKNLRLLAFLLMVASPTLYGMGEDVNNNDPSSTTYVRCPSCAGSGCIKKGRLDAIRGESAASSEAFQGKANCRWKPLRGRLVSPSPLARTLSDQFSEQSGSLGGSEFSDENEVVDTVGSSEEEEK